MRNGLRHSQLLADLGAFSRYQQVHFITHSMGGLVVKSRGRPRR